MMSPRHRCSEIEAAAVSALDPPTVGQRRDRARARGAHAAHADPAGREAETASFAADRPRPSRCRAGRWPRPRSPSTPMPPHAARSASAAPIEPSIVEHIDAAGCFTENADPAPADEVVPLERTADVPAPFAEPVRLRASRRSSASMAYRAAQRRPGPPTATSAASKAPASNMVRQRDRAGSRLEPSLDASSTLLLRARAPMASPLLRPIDVAPEAAHLA